MVICLTHRIHSWSRNTPPEAAGTCQPTVRLYWRSKNIWHSVHRYDSFLTVSRQWMMSLNLKNYFFCVDFLTECFKAYASSRHAPFCSRTAAHPINGGPDSNCKGQSSKHTLHHQILTVAIFMVLFRVSPPPVASPRSRTLPRALLVTASSRTARAARGSTTMANSSQPPSPLRCHRSIWNSEGWVDIFQSH